jgi:hypothetical protein
LPISLPFCLRRWTLIQNPRAAEFPIAAASSFAAIQEMCNTGACPGKEACRSMSDYLAYLLVEFVIWGGLGLVLGSALFCFDRFRQRRD